MVWDPLLKADPEGPTLIFHVAVRHVFIACCCPPLSFRVSLQHTQSDDGARRYERQVSGGVCHVQLRTREDVRVARELATSHSLTDMHEIYSAYLQTAFQHYREQFQKSAQRRERLAQQLAESTTADAKEAMAQR